MTLNKNAFLPVYIFEDQADGKKALSKNPTLLSLYNVQDISPSPDQSIHVDHGAGRILRKVYWIHTEKYNGYGKGKTTEYVAVISPQLDSIFAATPTMNEIGNVITEAKKEDSAPS